MGKILIIKDSDFSAVSVDKVTPSTEDIQTFDVLSEYGIAEPTLILNYVQKYSTYWFVLAKFDSLVGKKIVGFEMYVGDSPSSSSNYSFVPEENMQLCTMADPSTLDTSSIEYSSTVFSLLNEDLTLTRFDLNNGDYVINKGYIGIYINFINYTEDDNKSSRLCYYRDVNDKLGMSAFDTVESTKLSTFNNYNIFTKIYYID